MSPTPFFPVWSTLVYFDIFCYPLREDEIVRYCHYRTLNRIEIRNLLNQLIEAGLVFKLGNYYSLRNDLDLINRREDGNNRAIHKWEKAIEGANLIHKFPFVSAVWISGSLSKDFMDEKSDIDYFIITKPGRLWLARTFLILYKKIILLNSHKNFCLNYFLDEDHLQIHDENLFTATELLTLRPITNEVLYKKFLDQNQWANTSLPNFKSKPFDIIIENTDSKRQKVGEYFLEFLPLKHIDSLFLKITKRHWLKKFKTIPVPLMNQQLRSEKHVSKHHPQGYQHKVMRIYEERLEQSPAWIVKNEQDQVLLA